MKREIVPTSPKYKQKNKTEKEPVLKTKHKLNFLELFLILLVSFLGGFSASLIIDNYQTNWPGADMLINTQEQIKKELIYFREKPNNEEDLTSEAFLKIEPSVVSLFNKEFQNNYNAKNFLGSGLVITSDGWLITAKQIIASLENYQNLLIITNDKKNYQIKDVIIDDYSDVAFIKLTATDLIPAQFADTNNLVIGEEVAAVFNSSFSGLRADFTNLENLNFHDDRQFNTQARPFDFLITDNLRKEYKGSPLINNKGEVIGLNILDNRVIKNDYFTNIMAQIISEEKIKRIGLDLDYIDLSREIDFSDDETVLEMGAKIKNIKSEDEVLLVNDVILSIDDEQLDKQNNFNNILHIYKKGDTVNLKILRDEKEEEIEFNL